MGKTDSFINLFAFELWFYLHNTQKHPEKEPVLFYGLVKLLRFSFAMDIITLEQMKGLWALRDTMKVDSLTGEKNLESMTDTLDDIKLFVRDIIVGEVVDE